MITETLTLPLPSKILSPNARPNRFAKTRAVREARQLARREAYRLKNEWDFPLGFVVLSLRYVAYWKTSRGKWDDTNLTSSCKAYEDGIQDALLQDDRTWNHDQPSHNFDETNPRLEIQITIEAL
jgi:crossover junction endodeoxyribonuclease RusA